MDNRGFNLPAVKSGTVTDGKTVVGNDFTSDVQVRRAVNIGIDRNEMIDHVLNGYGSPAYSVCDKMPWYNESAKTEYDPEKAAELWRKPDGRLERMESGKRMASGPDLH